MALSLLKRILEASEELGQQVDRAIYGIRIAILTMLRPGEILGLRDRDIDFETGSICGLLTAPGGPLARRLLRRWRRVAGDLGGS